MKAVSETKRRVIVVEKTRSTSTGPCSITMGEAALRRSDGTVKKYVTRRWFTADKNELTPTQADNYLTGGRGRPSYEKTIYLIISIKGDERPRFAGSNDELSEVMRAATVEAMRVLAAGVEARGLIWVARTHPDYPHPCVKVLIRRDIGRGRSKVLKAFPRRLCSPCSQAFLRVFDYEVGKSISTKGEARKLPHAERGQLTDRPDERLEVTCAAASDESFLADLTTTVDDFRYADQLPLPSQSDNDRQVR